MRRRRARASVFAEPVLVGAVTTLVVVVAVFLAYNANRGLPFVPTTAVTIDLPDGQNLVPQNEVREGGFRVGLVDRMEPVRLPDGRVGARVLLKLDGDVPPYPVDSTFAVRPRSSLSLKYVELVRGRSRDVLADGDRIGPEQARSPVELDDVLNAFDEPTREGQRRSLRGFGDALAGRGRDINAALGELPRLLTSLEPVARTLAAPDTRLARLLRELGDTARVIRPVGEQYAESFADGADTFAALARDPQALRATIERTPPALRAGTRSLRAQRPFLRDLRGLSEDLRATTRQVVAAAPRVTRALDVAAPLQRRSVELSTRTRAVLAALDGLVRDGSTVPGLQGLGALIDTLNPTIRYLGPHVTVCNGFTTYWSFLSEHLSEPDPTGFSQRVFSIEGPRQDNSLASMGASQPANGENAAPGPGDPMVFHGQPYARAVDEQGRADCENWGRGYPRQLFKNNPDPARRLGAIDPRTPGLQGPGFDQFIKGKGVGLGPARVPDGQTFAAEAQTGEQLP